jgi:hypothetical protein
LEKPLNTGTEETKASVYQVIRAPVAGTRTLAKPELMFNTLQYVQNNKNNPESAQSALYCSQNTGPKN